MNALHTQRGSALVVTLIFLVLMSLFAISAFNSTGSNLRVVGNTQARQEAMSAADSALEAVITSVSQAMENERVLKKDPDFDPVAVSAFPIAVDINGDGISDYTANLSTPQCFRMSERKLEIPKEGLDIDDPETSCASEKACFDTDWDFAATVTDARTNTTVTAHQGMTITLREAEAAKRCTPPTP